MSFRVHNTQSYLTQEAIRFLKENDCQISFHQWQDLPNEEDEICREIQGVDAVIAGGEWYTPRVFEAADRLAIVARTGAGYDHVNLEAATQHGVWVTNTPGAVSTAVAEFTIGLVICLLRNLHGMAANMKRGVWEKVRGRELGSLTLGVIGTGSIGQEVIRLARGFGARVIAYDINENIEYTDRWQFKYVPLDDLMAESDVISLNVLLNNTTRGLIDEQKLRRMKKSAFLVNTSRAAVVDLVTLHQLLETKEIAGAALDVHDPAPCKPDDPLIKLDNVLATPWSAFNTEEAVARMSITAAKDVVAVLQGRKPEHPVNSLP